MNKNNFDFEEDFLIECVCENCGKTHNEEVNFCEECGGEELINETSHEGMECCKCGITFDMWDDCYVDGDKYLCKKCYKDLDEEE